MVQENRTIDLGELRVFAAIAHYGGLTSAAAALGVSKSTISHSLTRLEEGLGGRLFERSSRRVALTREGEQMLPRVQSLLAEADLHHAARDSEDCSTTRIGERRPRTARS
jgi:DNA-binding transcriptional LysR family regulator